MMSLIAHVDAVAIRRLIRVVELGRLASVTGLLLLACSVPSEGACGCGGTSDCLGLCLCESEMSEKCENICSERLPSQSVVPPSIADQRLAEELLVQINIFREKGGCCNELCFDSALVLVENEKLRKAALSHAADMVERSYISHSSLEGIDAVTRIRRAGYQSCSAGENISVGEENPGVVLGDFLTSYEHCLNIFELRYREVGVAVVRDENDEPYWVLTFGGQ